MNDLLWKASGVFLVLFGIALIIIRRRFSEYVTDKNNKLWGLPSNERWRRLGEVGTIGAGLGAIGTGMMYLLGVWSTGGCC